MYKIVKDFEKAIASYAGAKYGVAVSSCTNAIFLCCNYLFSGWSNMVTIPKRTYPGVACSIINANGCVKFVNKKWKGVYKLEPYPIYDSAKRFKKNMYIKGSYYCLSFHANKHLNIGRGGMILTDDPKAVKWFNRVKFDGRHEGMPLYKDKSDIVGWNMYLTPEQAMRGLRIFNKIKNENLPDQKEIPDYPDLSKWEAFKC
jgi:dTDP-4-amino-4,6-dideoxygalactose transaminase